MTLGKSDVTKALLHLKKDPIFKKLIQNYDLPAFSQRTKTDDLFAALVRAIVNQQLSGKAADTILQRFKNLYKPKSFPTPLQVIKTSDEKLRACGLSYSKIKYIKGLALAVHEKTLDLQSLVDLSDEEVIFELTKLKGIGKWTAEMILIFSLNRPDVFSLGDLGICTAVSRLYNVDRKNIKKIEKISLKWSPYRSIACWYLWRSLDNRPKVEE